MQISATVRSAAAAHEVSVRTDGGTRALAIPPKPTGGGSAVGFGGMASASFPGIGLAATDIRYRARIASSAPDAAIAELLRRTDAVAEVHNTLRAGVPVARVD